MKYNLIYESKRPKFAIMRDKRQWIISEWDGCRWRAKTFHSTLCLLLDELSEFYFRNNSRKVKELKDLERIIANVYKLNVKIGKELGTRLKNNQALGV